MVRQHAESTSGSERLSSQLQLRSRTVVDPRGIVQAQPVQLANRRPSIADLGLLLLLDNEKLQPIFGPYRAIFETLSRELLLRAPKLLFREAIYRLLHMSAADMSQLARAISSWGVDGVVIALCDTGVTQPSIMFAAELEAVGVPTIAICLDAAIGLATANALSLVPGLPLLTISAPRTASLEEVSKQTAALVNSVVEGLTTSPAHLKRSFQDRHPSPHLEAPPRMSMHDRMLHLDAQIAERVMVLPDSIATATIDPAGFAEDIYESFCAAHMTDGLPIIPPTRDRVDRMLTFTDWGPGDVIFEQLSPSGAAITVEKLATAAVMAGCLPEYFPIVLTAMVAMSDPRYRLFQAAITSHPGGNAIIVSGPLAAELQIASGGGCLGPGHRANATIGRAIGLCLLNVGGAIPGVSDLSVFGSPARYTFCLAEAVDRTPWTPLNIDHFDADTTTVTVHRCESPRNVLDHLSSTPEGVLGTIASVATTLGANNAYIPAELLVFLSPEHTRIIADAGWSKYDVQQYLFDQARNPAQALVGRGMTPQRPPWTRSLDEVPVVNSPEEVLVIVSGGTGGPQSMVSIPWGYARAVTWPVAHKDGRMIRSVVDMRAM